MNCEQVQPLLLAYLDAEVTPSERMLVQAHLSGCTVCQQELDLLSTARSQVRAALQRRASQGFPSREAWSRLEARLTEDAQPSSKFTAWFSRKAPNVGRASNQIFGGVTMQKRWIFSGLAGVIALSVLAIFVAQTATPVSARQILDRAYEAQSTQSEGGGLQHSRIETYHNLCARPEGAGVTTIMESYLEFQTGHFRTVIMEAETGHTLEVYAFDGSHIYTGHRSVEVNADHPEQGTQPKHIVCDDPWGITDEVLTVYRGTQDSVASTAKVAVSRNEETSTHEEIFEKMRSDPNAELLGEETWLDGRTVYVLRSRQPVKTSVEGSMEAPMGWVRSYFDTESYEIVESRATIEKDGEELLIYSYRVLANETLPIGSYQNWDLRDLQGITIVDDPEGQYVDFLPEVISEQKLAAYTESAYLLESIPDGFTLEISSSPNQSKDQPFVYVASYRNEADDYFVIQAIGSRELKFVAESSTDTYNTASGLKLTFMNLRDSTDQQFTSAVVETPEGDAFLISSTLPREQVEALAEDLMLVK